MHRNTEILWLKKCSAEGKGCLTTRLSGENVVNIAYT